MRTIEKRALAAARRLFTCDEYPMLDEYLTKHAKIIAAEFEDLRIATDVVQAPFVQVGELPPGAPSLTWTHTPCSISPLVRDEIIREAVKQAVAQMRKCEMIQPSAEKEPCRARAELRSGTHLWE